MNIGGLIGIALAMVIGVVLITPVVTTVNDLPSTTPDTVMSMANLVPIVFVAILIIGAIGYVAYSVTG
jgi:hypothetical protein